MYGYKNTRIEVNTTLGLTEEQKIKGFEIAKESSKQAMKDEQIIVYNKRIEMKCDDRKDGLNFKAVTRLFIYN